MNKPQPPPGLRNTWDVERISFLEAAVEREVRARHEFGWVGFPDRVAERLFGAEEAASMDLCSGCCDCMDWDTREADEATARTAHASHVALEVAKALGAEADR